MPDLFSGQMGWCSSLPAELTAAWQTSCALVDSKPIQGRYSSGFQTSLVPGEGIPISHGHTWPRGPLDSLTRISETISKSMTGSRVAQHTPASASEADGVFRVLEPEGVRSWRRNFFRRSFLFCQWEMSIDSMPTLDHPREMPRQVDDFQGGQGGRRSCCPGYRSWKGMKSVELSDILVDHSFTVLVQCFCTIFLGGLQFRRTRLNHCAKWCAHMSLKCKLPKFEELFG